MKLSMGMILVIFGNTYPLLSIGPMAFGKQIRNHSLSFMPKISDVLSQSQILNGQFTYKASADFRFFNYVSILIPLGTPELHLEKKKLIIPVNFVNASIAVVLICIFLIPFTEMTLFCYHLFCT